MLRVRVLVVSDLHLGAASRLPGADGELSVILRQGWDRVVILGDFLDLWVSTIAEIYERHAALLALLRHMDDVFYVVGNHDAMLRGMRELDGIEVVNEPFVYSDGGRVIALDHGDAYDPIDYRASRMANCMVTMADRFAQWGAGPGVSVYRTVCKSFAGVGSARSKYVDEIRDRAMEALDADVVGLGHTHVPVPTQALEDDRFYFNSGDFGPEHLSYVVIEDGMPFLKRA